MRHVGSRGQLRTLVPCPATLKVWHLASMTRGRSWGGPVSLSLGPVRCSGRKGEIISLPELPGTNRSEARAINNVGQIVGESGRDAVLWQNGEIVVLGGLPGSQSSGAHGINETGQIVGLSGEGERGQRAVLWQEGGRRTRYASGYSLAPSHGHQ